MISVWYTELFLLALQIWLTIFKKVSRCFLHNSRFGSGTLLDNLQCWRLPAIKWALKVMSASAQVFPFVPIQKSISRSSILKVYLHSLRLSPAWPVRLFLWSMAECNKEVKMLQISPSTLRVRFISLSIPCLLKMHALDNSLKFKLYSDDTA